MSATTDTTAEKATAEKVTAEKAAAEETDTAVPETATAEGPETDTATADTATADTATADTATADTAETTDAVEPSSTTDAVEPSSTTDAVEPSSTTETAPAGSPARRLLPIVLAALLVASAVAVALLGWGAYSESRAQRTQDAALAAARDNTTQVLSYNSTTLDADLARSRGLISGGFAAKFEELASTVIVPAVRQQSLSTKATVVRAAVIDAQPDQVRALLFVNQTTTVGGQPAPHNATNQVRVTMTWTNGKWLISDMQPL
jgi:Mce-associated membrane protein